MQRTIHPLSIVILLAGFLGSCAGPVAEDVDLDALLPEGAMQKIARGLRTIQELIDAEATGEQE